jgi:hypothetical protein
MDDMRIRDMPVITFHIEQTEKEELEKVAKSKGMGLATYCRMLLLESLENIKKGEI